MELTRRIVLEVEGMDRVVVRAGLSYPAADGQPLRMDVYIPYIPFGADRDSRRPAVLLVHGGPVPPEMSPPDWGIFRSYGELLAASGLVAVTFQHRLHALADYERAASDVRALIDHVRSNAVDLQLDPDRLSLWAFSGAGALLGVAFQLPMPSLRCVVSYYGILDLREPTFFGMPGAVPEPLASELSPAALIADRPGPFPPTLIARAGADDARINQSVDDFVLGALKRDVDLDLLALPQARHGFDVLDDTPRSREVIKRTVAFLLSNLEQAR